MRLALGYPRPAQVQLSKMVAYLRICDDPDGDTLLAS
jgi:hypothetical protein